MMQATGPHRGRAVRRAALGVLALSLLWALAIVTHPPAAEAADPPRALTANSQGVLEIITVPKLPGIRFTVDGRTYRANNQGVVRLKVKSLDEHTVSVIDKKISQKSAQGERGLEFVRWYHGSRDQAHLDELSGLKVRRNLRIKAAYRATYKLQYSFVDKARNQVDRTRVSRVEFRSDQGRTVTTNGRGQVTLVGIRPVESGGTVVAKKVSYTVQHVDVDGSNVVQVNAQRFEPSRKATVVIPLQLHTLHFSTRDFLFGGPVGKAVWLKYPNGHRFRVPLDANGKATVENLARGSYTVQVDAPGLSFERPLVLSRTQYVDLQHVSRLDMAVAAGAIAAFMLTLYLVRVRGRPGILRLPRLGTSHSGATQRTAHVTMSIQQSSTQEMAEPKVAAPPSGEDEKDDRAVAATVKMDGEKELAEVELKGAQSYRTQVAEAQLPDEIRKAALSEVGTLERISAQNPEASEIRIWLDTVLHLPWITQTGDSINVPRAPKVNSVAAGTENLQTEKADPTAADTDDLHTETVDTAAADTHDLHTETVDTAAADTKIGDGEQVDPRLTGEIAYLAPPWITQTQVVDGDAVDSPAAEVEKADTAPVNEPVLQKSAGKRRFGPPALAAAVLAALLVGTLLFATSRDGGATAQSVPTVTATATATATTTASKMIQVEALPDPARPLEAVRIHGTYHGGAYILLRIQRMEEGKWRALPLPAKTGPSGEFTTYVEFGQQGRYQLRVLDPDSGVTSQPFVLVIQG